MTLSPATTMTRRQRPGPDPVLGKGDALGGARARGVDLGVRPARADDLGELGVPHRQHAEEEPAVERVGLGLQILADARMRSSISRVTASPSRARARSACSKSSDCRRARSVK